MLYGIQRFSNMGTELWDLLPRNNSSHCVFKNKIIKWIPGKCPCELCQTHIKKSTKYIKKKKCVIAIAFYSTTLFKQLYITTCENIYINISY